MDKTLKEKLIDSTFQGINKIIENTYKNHPDEKSYSGCRIQEGYDDYLKIGKIEYRKDDFFGVIHLTLK